MNAKAADSRRAFTTARDVLFTQAGLSPGERLLMSGAAGGAGTAVATLRLPRSTSVC
jgi:NADPH2:quinone reductase